GEGVENRKWKIENASSPILERAFAVFKLLRRDKNHGAFVALLRVQELLRLLHGHLTGGRRSVGLGLFAGSVVAFARAFRFVLFRRVLVLLIGRLFLRLVRRFVGLLFLGLRLLLGFLILLLLLRVLGLGGVGRLLLLVLFLLVLLVFLLLVLLVLLFFVLFGLLLLQLFELFLYQIEVVFCVSVLGVEVR